jgi:hypothetical protein
VLIALYGGKQPIPAWQMGVIGAAAIIAAAVGWRLTRERQHAIA